MTLKGYADAGGVAARSHIPPRRSINNSRPTNKTTGTEIFLRLTELGEGTEDTRRRASFGELIPDDENRRVGSRRAVRLV